MVLLKNNGFLPIDVTAYKSVAMVGPCADDPTCNKGDYDPQPAYIVTPRAAFSKRSGLAVSTTQLLSCFFYQYRISKSNV